MAVAGGVFSVLLGETPQPAITLDFGEDYWLLVSFQGDLQSPRKRLGSVGHAYMASGLVAGTEVSGSVTSGTAAAMKGTNTATAGACCGLYGENASVAGMGVYGYVSATTGQTEGAFGVVASTEGRGVVGWAQATTGVTRGVYGRSDSPDGYGVYYQGGISGTGLLRAIVRTPQGPTALDAATAAGSWVEDFGDGRLVNGRAHVGLDPVFLETVTIDEENPMKVFVELSGDCNGVFVTKSITSFDAIELQGGTSAAPFDYRVIAKRKGFEHKRLDCCAAAEHDSYLYPELRQKERREIEALGARHEEARIRAVGERARMELERGRMPDRHERQEAERAGSQQ